MKKVSGPQVVTASGALESPLSAEIQETLGELVGAAREGLLALSVSVGLGVVHSLMEREVDEVVGPKHKQNPDRTAKRHGHESGSMTLGGRRVSVSRPRMRTADDKHELPVASYEYFADRDPLTRAVMDRMLAGVSTRKYASVRCFADPDAHAHGDRHPSCSVSLASGAWRCWACDARGGAYDAAIACGLRPRDAMDLLILHGLAERRAASGGHLHARARPSSPAAHAPEPRNADEPALAISEAELAEARERLVTRRWPLSGLRAEQRRLWSRAIVLEELGCGWEHGRLLFPIRDRSNGLRGVLRYAPHHDRARKMLAVAGTRRGLVPHPAAETVEWVVLVEGPPDMISARSCGLPAIAVPGDHAWEAEWVRLLVGRRVSVVMDCDRAGREAAARIASDPRGAGVHGAVIDLAPGRDNGYDLTDWLYEHRGWPLERIRAALGYRGAPATCSLNW